MQTIPFFKLGKELVVETCLLGITVLSYLVPKRTDIFVEFERVLGEHLSSVLAMNSILVPARLTLLMGYYADAMFLNKDKEFNEVMEFLFRKLQVNNKREKAIAF